MYNALIAIEDGLALSRTPEQLREEIANDVEKNPTTYRAVIFRDGAVFGYIRSYAFGMDTKYKRVIFEFDALGELIEDELVELLREQALYVARLRDAKKLVYKTRDPKLFDAIERMGGEINAEAMYFKLDIRNANTALMERAIEQHSQLPFTLKFYDKLPEEIIPEFCERFTGFLTDMPGNPDVEIVDPKEFSMRQETRDPNQRYIRGVLFDAAQKIVGFSSIMIDLRNPDLGYQHMTGVIRELRGKGLGLYIKSMTFFKLREDYPEMKYVSTDTLAGNIYMQHVNRQLGYEKRADAREYRLMREALEAFAVA